MSQRKKILLLKQNELETDFKKAELAHKSNPIKTNLVKIQTIRAALNTVLNEKASRSLFYQRQRPCEYGNKPSKYLVRLLSQKQNHNTIAGIGKDTLTGKTLLLSLYYFTSHYINLTIIAPKRNSKSSFLKLNYQY